MSHTTSPRFGVYLEAAIIVPDPHARPAPEVGFTMKVLNGYLFDQICQSVSGTAPRQQHDLVVFHVDVEFAPELDTCFFDDPLGEKLRAFHDLRVPAGTFPRNRFNFASVSAGFSHGLGRFQHSTIRHSVSVRI